VTLRAHRRALAAFAAVMLVGCTLLVGWHKATVMHGVCAEHGDELHLDRVGEHERAEASDSAQLESSTWVQVDGDHHCVIAATSRDPISTAAGHDLAALPDLCDDTSPPHALVAPAAVALYRLAPKTSPPV
jgi:hypothetical protein